MSLEERVAQLEARLQHAEDYLAILSVLNTYGRLIDGGKAMDAAHLWDKSGFIRVKGYPKMEAYDGIAAAMGSPAQLEMNESGCMHLINSPKIKIDGDRAEAVTYNLVIHHYWGNFGIWRAAVNHWIFERKAEGWKVVERYSSEVDGSEGANELILKVMD